MNDLGLLQELTVKDLDKFALDNNLGTIIEIRYRKNPTKEGEKVSHEPVSIELGTVNDNGMTRYFSFSKHGLANLSLDGKKYYYETDSEERFLAEHTEFIPLSFEWVKLLATKDNVPYIDEEIEYRKKLHDKIDHKRQQYAALRTFYAKQLVSLESMKQKKSKAYKKTLNEYNDFAELCETCSALKMHHTKCIKHLEKVLENRGLTRL